MRIDRESLWSESAGSNRTLWLTAAILLVTLLFGVSGSLADTDSIQRGIDAGAARYQAMAESYPAKSEAARSARWAALGASYLAGFTDDLLAASPELKIARAGYSQSSQSIGECVRIDEGRLVASPELAIAARMGTC
jgi:hypothetical protein